MDLYLLETILILLVAHSHSYDLDNLKQCCDKNVTLYSASKTCDNGKAISLKCPLSDTLVFLDRQYVITEDASGVYVDTFQPDTIIREPKLVFFINQIFPLRRQYCAYSYSSFYIDGSQSMQKSLSFTSLNFSGEHNES